MFHEYGNEEGFTGLEAAIVLIAFIVVASVFSYVVLGAGFYTTQKAQETVFRSVEQATTNVQLSGNVYGLSSNTAEGIDQIRFTIGVVPGTPYVNMEKMNIVVTTPTYGPKILVWTNQSTSTKDTNFIALKNGVGSSQSTMTSGDQMDIQCNITAVPRDTKITIEIRPGLGASYIFSKTTPSIITPNNLIY
ncbi:MAG: flagellin [Methanoregula sp.]|jgi:flagellin FlaB|nr:flagellin [Methanoregula sp.]